MFTAIKAFLSNTICFTIRSIKKKVNSILCGHQSFGGWQPHSTWIFLINLNDAFNKVNVLTWFELCKRKLSHSHNCFTTLLKLINCSCSSYPTRSSYSGQVDEFRNPMKSELKTRPWKKSAFETISNTDEIFLNLHIDKAAKHPHVAINNFI